ncbi:SDR family oxidoreductase [Parasphingorhabdus flavimaris]|uniref:SDR family oxidoreductase n=1 Tax=Parasphingorhabdus flavimaris TaxID=266812 RepID=A0ABX2MZD1_9SPHN|nr:SDR family oxidoreductase [Parasphingorhabdus flavimaris]NVD26802.1 SDR family oxidoreductase [Parasphingorhabdus flavimaris]
MNAIENKSIIITGASQGIGAATARYLAAFGATVILVARSASKLERVANAIAIQGGYAVTIAGSVADYQTLESAVRLAVDRTGRLDVLVNNAGIIDPVSRIADSDPEAWSQVVDVNLKGVYNGLRAALPEMIAAKSGTIINISSGAATGAMEGWSHYCSTKAAVLSLTRCTHKEYAEHGIHCVGLSPGTVATEMQGVIRDSGINPVSKLDWSHHIPPEWVAQAIAFLMSREGEEFAGGDFSLKTNEGRAIVGLPAL